MTYELPDGILKEKHGTREYQLQIHCIDYLQGRKRIKGKTYPITRPFPQLWHNNNPRWTHIATAREGDQAFFLQQMGLRRGIFDLMLWWEAGIHFIDLKATGGLSADQRQFADDMRRIGIKTATASTVAQFRDQLIAWNLTCENPTVTEPPLSLEKRQLAYLEMMRPQ